MGVPAYCNAAVVRRATDLPVTPDADDDIARAIDDASRAIERMCLGRRFYPVSETRTMDWPDRASVNVDSRKLWLDDNELLSLSALSIGGTSTASYRLGPEVSGQPYQWIEIDADSTTTFTTDDTSGYQDAISLTGVFGFTSTLAASGALNGAVATTTATSVTTTDGSKLDIGDAIKIDSEYLIITGTAWSDTTEDLLANLTVDSDDNTVAVADGTAYVKGERLLVGTERMRIDDIAANNLIVSRAVEGSTLAAHTLGDDIYAVRTYIVDRGQLGTTAATHADAAVVQRHVPPAGVTSLCLAEAIVQLAQENAGYARTIGSGDNEREARGAGLKSKRDDVKRRYKPKGRHYATGGKQ